MRDMGETMQEMYPSSSDSKDRKHYQRLSLHRDMFPEGKLVLDKVHHIKGKVKIVGHDPETNKVHVELHGAEMMEDPKEEKSETKKEEEKETVLGGK
jgi:hypothetical protein